MDAKASLVGFAGLGLVAADVWTTPAQRSAITTFNLAGWKPIGLELLGVVVLTVIANVSDQAANLSLVVVLGLWILWAIHHFSNGGLPGVVSKAKASSQGSSPLGGKQPPRG